MIIKFIVSLFFLKYKTWILIMSLVLIKTYNHNPLANLMSLNNNLFFYFKFNNLLYLNTGHCHTVTLDNNNNIIITFHASLNYFKSH